jgi:spore germination cell wall hydrolase CwlJ-like protein
VCQFSWTCTDKTAPNKSSNAYRQAEEIARKILIENEWSDVIPHNVLFFHAIEVNPLWKYKKFATIGNHIFYERITK